MCTEQVPRADVRHVFHVNLPKTMEAFYQEAGRAGRDGLPAKSLCFYKEADRERMTYILGESWPLPNAPASEDNHQREAEAWRTRSPS